MRGALITTGGTHIQILCVHARVDQGETLDLDVASDANGFAYARSGSGDFGPRALVQRSQLVAFATGGPGGGRSHPVGPAPP